jgi:hypothetical protein
MKLDPNAQQREKEYEEIGMLELSGFSSGNPY